MSCSDALFPHRHNQLTQPSATRPSPLSSTSPSHPRALTSSAIVPFTDIPQPVFSDTADRQAAIDNVCATYAMSGWKRRRNASPRLALAPLGSGGSSSAGRACRRSNMCDTGIADAGHVDRACWDAQSRGPCLEICRSVRGTGAVVG